MTQSKKNIMLAVLLVAQVALIAFSYRPGQNAAPVTANLFPELSPEKVTGLTITDDQGKAITLAKKESWQLSPEGFPADQTKIDALIKKLAELKTQRLVSQTTSSHSRLKVADSAFNRQVELSQGDKKTVFFLGTAPSSKSIHLRLAAAKEVYQVNDLSAWEVAAEKESWWQTSYLNQPLDTLTGVTIANASGTIALVSDGKKGWQLKDKPETTLDSKRVEMVISSLADMAIASYQPKEFAAKGEPVATVTYQTNKAGAGAVTLQIWPKEKKDDPEQVVKSSASSWYAKAKEYVLKEAVELKQDGLIAKPPTGEAFTQGEPGSGETPAVAMPPAVGEPAPPPVAAPPTTPAQ
jgi:hypothetical protein